MPPVKMEELVVSGCANPEAELDDVLRAYASLGYRRFEGFTDWVKSALDDTRDPRFYRDKAAEHGMRFYSIHLPRFSDEDFDGSLERAVRATRFAAALGMTVVYPRATSRGSFIRAGRPFLEAIEGLGVTPAIELHKGYPVDDLATLREVLEGIGDQRMKAVLEVGHLHNAGETWRQAWEALADRIAVVHVKDQIGSQSVALGTGEIDLPGMLEHLKAAGYAGDYVVELLVKDRENTLTYLADARRYLQRYAG